MNWFRVSRGRLVYRGRISRQPFTRWTATKEGAETIARLAAGIRFSLFGRARAAKRRAWRALESVTRAAAVAMAIGEEADAYMRACADVSYGDALPRAHVALHRLVLVPRAMAASRARASMVARLGRIPELCELDLWLRSFLFDQLLSDMDLALQQASPSVTKPVQAHGAWACVGVSGSVQWGDPIWAGPYGTGHVFMYEFPATGLSRKERKGVQEAIRQLEAGVSTLSRNQRFEVARAASHR
jgi:hypothetical protein